METHKEFVERIKNEMKERAKLGGDKFFVNKFGEWIPVEKLIRLINSKDF